MDITIGQTGSGASITWGRSGLAGDVLFAASGSGILAAISAKDGSSKWKRNVHLPIRSAPKIAEGLLLIITADSRLQAYNQEDGRLLWEHRAIVDSASGVYMPAAAMAGDGVVAAFASGEVYVLRRQDGREVWRTQIQSSRRTDAAASLNYFICEPFMADGRIYIASQSGVISALDFRSGVPIWQKETEALQSMWMAGDTVFILTRSQQVAAIRREDGRVMWVQNLPTLDERLAELPSAWLQPVVLNEELWLFHHQGLAVVLQASDGSLKRVMKNTPDKLVTSPAITEDALWFVNKDAQLLKF